VEDFHESGGLLGAYINVTVLRLLPVKAKGKSERCNM